MLLPWPRRHAFFTAALLLAFPMGCDESDTQDVVTRDASSASDLGSASPDAGALLPDSLPPAPDLAPSPEVEGALDAEADDLQSAPADADIETGASPPDALPSADLKPPTPLVTVVVMPDTQYYSSSYPNVFSRQTAWIVEEKAKRNIAAVLHVGDVVDYDIERDWSAASRALRVLDNQVPYVLAVGNHDLDGTRKTMMNSYFGPASMPWITGTMVAGRIENSYALLDIGPTRWLVLSIEFSPRDAVLSWADTVLKAYPDRPAILITHAYLYHDGKRYDIAVSGMDPTKPNYQNWIPQYYGFTPAEGINDGEAIWQKLVLPNTNVRMVLSGHDTGSAHLASTRPDGSVVIQILSDFQWYRTDQPDYYGGGGYLLLLEFDYQTKQVSAQTYSPFLDRSLAGDGYRFSFALDM